MESDDRVTYVITNLCASEKSGACVRVCPVDCIHPGPDEDGFEGVEQLYIDPEVCIDCGACVMECPVDAIFADHNVPTEMADATEVNAAFFRGDRWVNATRA